MGVKVRFYELAIGAVFRFYGRRYEKVAMSMAEDERRWGYVFGGDCEVEPEGEARLLPPEVAALWKPSDRNWADDLEPAPGQGGRDEDGAQG